MNYSTSKLICVTAVAALCILLAEIPAAAACASSPAKQWKANNLFEIPRAAEALASQSHESAFEIRDDGDDDGNASIVGLWSITYYVGRSSNIWDQGFEQWHSDGLELNNDNAVPPSLGNVCVGVYKRVGSRTFKLRHVTWNFDTSGQLTGTFQLLQTVVVAPNGNTFSGTYTSDSFDLNGKVIPSLHAEGILSAKRITVD